MIIDDRRSKVCVTIDVNKQFLAYLVILPSTVMSLSTERGHSDGPHEFQGCSSQNVPGVG